MRYRHAHMAIVLTILTALLLAGCGGADDTPAPDDAPADVTQITLMKESVGLGDPVVTYMLTVDVPDLHYTLEEKDADPFEGTVTAEQIAALLTALDEAGFWGFEADYIPDDGTCCDLVYFTVGATRGGTTVTARGSETESPEAFMGLVDMVEALTAP